MLVDRRGGSGPFVTRDVDDQPQSERSTFFCPWTEEQEACVSGASAVTEALDQFAKQGGSALGDERRTGRSESPSG